VLFLSLSFLLLANLAAAQNLELDLTPGAADEAAGTQVVHMTLRNPKTIPVSLVAFEFYSFPARVVTVSGDGWDCWNAQPGHELCRFVPAIEAGGTTVADFTLSYPTKAGHTRVTVGVRWNEPVAVVDTLDVALYRRFAVTHNGDGGAGSLRDAIRLLNADAACINDPCRVDFQTSGIIDVLQSPLPLIAAGEVLLDGESKIEIRGDALEAGEGLQIHSRNATVRGLAVTGFPFNGVSIQPPIFGGFATFVFENDRIARNGHRGLVVSGGVFTGIVRDNVFENNRRSGLFVADSQSVGFSLAPVFHVTGNRVVDNGASGMFFGPTSDGAFVHDNVITGNGDFGVAIGRGARNMRVESNVIAGNGVSAIDIGLDGPNRVATLFSASFDPATGRTTITGAGESIGYGTLTQTFYASDAPGNVRELIGSVASDPRTGAFTAVFDRDLRGKYIASITLRTINADGSLLYDTSELSNAVRVE
ncbi:MAG TPA: right-handed parallel beta-helix repeat-containing protein, partial [Thermoanaerobaculia bacterium]|nr:right-handed parallel beta-helix repeat-containing protein [Thermoanaerobaculia bacterium]